MNNIICIDIGGTFMKYGMLNQSIEIIQKGKIPSDTSGTDKFLECIDQIVTPFLPECDGIAISMPGKINTEKGIAVTGGSFTSIDHFPIRSVLEEKYHIPVSVANDGKCAANAEVWLGALKDVPNGIVYILGTGIGGGIVIDHKVVAGSHFAAGEFSFCANNLNSAHNADNMIYRQISTISLLKNYESATGDAIDGFTFFQRLNSHEKTAEQLFEEFCTVTAAYLFDLQAILDVDRIAIGGGISAQPLLIRTVDEKLTSMYHMNLPLACEKPEITKCHFGNDANIIGALKYFMDSTEKIKC
jgi:predicted NBD/HSP70 family sugar kinase